MSRNANSRFSVNPTTIDISRSTFSRNSSLKTSFNVGDIVPIYLDEVLPGDTFNVKTSKVVRLQTLITPMMDNLYLDTYFFFVPNRLVWEHWQNFMGENTDSAWIPAVEYEVPQITAPAETGWTKGTIADYFGVPTNIPNLSISALPFRAYALIINDWFRDQNLSNPLNIPVNDTTIQGVNTGTFVTDVVKGGLPYKASKYHDYFTSALPGPQKGPNVTIGLSGDAPVFGNGGSLGFVTSHADPNQQSFVMPVRYSAQPLSGESVGYDTMGIDFGHPHLTADPSKLVPPGTSSNIDKSAPSTTYNSVGVPTKEFLEAKDYPYGYTGLVADLGLANSISVNALRLAFQIQKLYEKDARGGSRYIELLKSHFGVTSPDARLQRPEYLGGNRLPISINQVVQQSETAKTPQGNVAGYSVTTDTHSDFTKSFVEHGFIIGLAVVRYDHTYQQGLQRFWSRKDRFDYYWPVLANIGEQPILNKEIYAQGNNTDNEVFGYQEAWADYRYKPSIVTGEMRSNYQTSLDSWHLADDYQSLPYLSSSWIAEDQSNVDRVLAVQSSVSNQLFGDFYFQCKTTRAMPLYSIPGLIDHH